MAHYPDTLVGLCIAVMAMPASSAIIVSNELLALQSTEGVRFIGTLPSAPNAFGVTDQTSTSLTFAGTEALAIRSAEQVSIAAFDGGLDQLHFCFTDPSFGFVQCRVHHLWFRRLGDIGNADLAQSVR